MILDETSQRSVIFTWVLLAVTALLWIAVLAVLIMPVPHYEQIFRDFRVKLPDATIWLLNADRWVIKYWYMALLPGAILFCGVIFLSLYLRHRTRGALLLWLWFGTWIGVPLLMQAGIWMCLLLPLH